LLKRSIVDSDGSASDAVMHLLGGPREVRRYMKQAEIKQIHVEHTEMQLIDNNHFQYDDWAKPDGIVNLLVRLQAGKLLNETDTALLLGWMRETTTGADRIRAMLPKETEVADKTGTSGMNDGIAPATNDVGLVTLPTGQHLAIAIFLSDAKGDTKARNAAIAGVAREVWDCWTEEQK
jgi:beta-lactamase class A